MRSTPISFPLAVAFGLLAAACGGKTTTVETHPHVSRSAIGTAKVYFLRPNVGYELVERGAFKVSLEGEELLSIQPGEYTLVYLKPGPGSLSVEGTTVMSRNGKSFRSKVKHASAIPLQAGRTYYVGFVKHARSITDGGGTSFSAVVLPEEQVTGILKTVKPIGLALLQPISVTVVAP